MHPTDLATKHSFQLTG